mgnify:CR=1 FL=1
MKKIYLIIVFILASVSLSAQNLRTGYFLDGYSYRYQFNPALQGDRGFLAIPIFSRIGVGVESSIGLRDYLYPTSSGTLATFLHPEISNDVVMRNLGNRTIANTNVDLNVLAFGFRVKKSYHTFDVSLKGNMDTTLPGDVFRFMKVGGSDGNAVYDFSDLSLSSDAYAQVAYGFSRRFLDKFNVGIRLKGLMGIESVRTKIKDLSLKMDGDQWMVKAEGNAMFSSIPASIAAGEDDITTEQLMSLVQKPNIGFAVDLGVSVDLFKYLTLSASIVDLGLISWNNVATYRLSNEPWIYEGFNLSTDQNVSNNFNEQLDAELNKLGSLFNVEDMTPEMKAKHMQKLAMTAHVGVEARLPFYERLSVGILGTHRFNGSHSWTEGRFSLNWALLRWFSLAANYAISDLGHSYGAAINLHPKGFSLFLGTDSFRPVTALAPGEGFVPLNEINTNVVLGVNFPFGKYNGRFPKKIKEPKKDKKSKKDKD